MYIVCVYIIRFCVESIQLGRRKQIKWITQPMQYVLCLFLKFRTSFNIRRSIEFTQHIQRERESHKYIHSGR